MKAWKPKYRWFHIPANGLRNWIRCFASTCNNAAPTPATTETIATVTKPFVLYESELATVYKGDCRDVIPRSEEHTSELQSRGHLVCRLLLEKKKTEQRLK